MAAPLKVTREFGDQGQLQGGPESSGFLQPRILTRLHLHANEHGGLCCHQNLNAGQSQSS